MSDGMPRGQKPGRSQKAKPPIYIRADRELYEALCERCKAEQVSINTFVQEVLERELREAD